MKYILLHADKKIGRMDTPVICVNYCWKYYDYCEGQYFDSYDALIEFINSPSSSLKSPYIDDQVIAAAQLLGRFNVIRTMLRDKKIKYIKAMGGSTVERVRFIFGADCRLIDDAPVEITETIAAHENMISVLVINLNNWEYTINCVRDLLNQDTDAFTVTVYDQASDEAGTEIAMHKIMCMDPRVNVIMLSTRMPLNQLWNDFITSESAPYVCCLNNDVKLPSNFLSHTIKAMNIDDRIGIACHATNNLNYNEVCNGLKYIILPTKYTGGKPNTITGLPVKEAYIMQGWDFTVRRKLYVRIPNTIRTYAGDAWIYYKMYEHGYKCAMILSAPIIHYLSKSAKFRMDDPVKDTEELHRLIGIHDWTVHPDYSNLEPTYSAFYSERIHLVRDSFADGDVMLIVTNISLSGGSQLFLKVVDEQTPQVKKYVFTIKAKQLLLTDMSGKVIEKISDVRMLPDIVKKYGVSFIVVNHVLGFEVLSTLTAITKCRAPYTFVFHDFICLCTCVHLFYDEKMCNMKCDSACRYFNGLAQWRAQFYNFLKGARRLLANSKFTADRILRYYPDLNIQTIRYDIERSIKKNVIDVDDIDRGPLHIAVPGAIGQHKGSVIIYKVADMLKANNINAKFTIIGYSDRQYEKYNSPYLSITGKYDRNDLSKIYDMVRPHVSLIASVVEETFCYTSSESLQIGTPIITYNLGAQQDKVENGRCGWIMNISDPVKNMYNLICQLAVNRNEIKNKIKNIRSATKIHNDDVTVIIPVFNAFEEMKACICSIDEGTDVKCNLIIIDDLSDDPRIVEYLNEFKPANKLINYVFVRSYVNHGFIKTVNVGLNMAASSDCLILNSDTLVPKNWLGRITAFASENEDAASITPYSNSAGLCSFPKMLERNIMVNNLSVNDIDLHFQEALGSERIEMPTGNGFCMYMSRKAIDDIGCFDEVFDMGYGEENDWCMRAIKAGYVNLHMQTLFVYHSGSASFGQNQKSMRGENNYKLLQSMHPEYVEKVKSYVSKDPCQISRSNVLRSINECSKPTR